MSAHEIEIEAKVLGLDPQAQDMWAVGVCLFVLLTAQFPFGTDPHSRREYLSLLSTGPPLSAADGGGVSPTGAAAAGGGSQQQDNSRFWSHPTRAHIRTGILALPEGNEILHLLNALFSFDQRTRPTAEAVLNHAWLKGYEPEDSSGGIRAWVYGEIQAPLPGTMLECFHQRCRPGVLLEKLQMSL